MVINVGHVAGNFAAYGFAPATLVAPMGAVSVIANAAVASILLAEEFRRRDVSGSFLIIGGGVGLVFFSPHQEKQLNSATLMAYIFSDIFFMYSGVLMLLLVTLMSVHKRWAREWVVVDLSLCAILGSWTVMATKGLSVSVRMTMLGEIFFLSLRCVFFILFFISYCPCGYMCYICGTQALYMWYLYKYICIYICMNAVFA
jgi:hypothetical protein